MKNDKKIVDAVKFMRHICDEYLKAAEVNQDAQSDRILEMLILKAKKLEVLHEENTGFTSSVFVENIQDAVYSKGYVISKENAAKICEECPEELTKWTYADYENAANCYIGEVA